MKLIQWVLKKIVLLLLGAGVIFYGIQFYIDSIGNRFWVTLEEAPASQAILVLGAAVYGNKTPTPVLEDRLCYALTLYENRKAGKIIVSGDHGKEHYDEVTVMKNYLLEKGVPREDIFLDHAGFNTYDSMIRARDIFGVETLLISTQEFHMNRSIYIARRLGIEAYGYPCPDKEIYGMETLNMREQLAKVKAFLEVEILKRAPTLGGEEIPVTGDGRATEDGL